MKYFFILGKTPDLSVLEIVNFANKSQIKFVNVSRTGKNVLLVDVEKEIDIVWFMNQLGGIVKAGRIVDIQQIKADFITDFLEKNIDKNKKFYFGFSVYGEYKNIKTFKQI